MKRRSFLKSILAATCLAVSMKLDILTPDVAVVAPEPEPKHRLMGFYAYETIGAAVGHTSAIARVDFT
jgi:hypothetical protein